MAKNAAEVIAFVLGEDMAEVTDGRYHYGHTAIPVYVVGGNYYCCPTKGKQPPKDEDEGFDWIAYGEAYGRTVYECVPPSPYDPEGKIEIGSKIEINDKTLGRFYKQQFKVTDILPEGRLVVMVRKNSNPWSDDEEMVPALIAPDRVLKLRD